MDMLELSRKLHPLERKVLPNLEKTISFEQLVEKCGMQEVEVMRAVQWMENKGIVTVKKEEKEIISLDRNGLDYKKNGLPEKRFLDAVKDKALSLAEIGKKAGLDQNELSISMGLLRKKNAIDVKKDKELIVSISKEGKEFLKKETAEEKFLDLHFPVEESKLEKDQKAVFDEFMKRKEIVKKERRAMREISLTGTGEKLSKLKISDNVADKLTSKMLKEGSWQKKEFRKYDVEINVPKISGGKRHFTNQAVEYIKNIWLDLGFREMTGNMVQTSFWDLDALFVPQDHPARDMQDTFYIKDPKYGKLPKELMKKIMAVHENGWTTGSKGWQYKWSEEEAKKLLMITHDTYLSAKTLASIKKEDLPIKTFQIMKVFRNEMLSWKSLFEFIQVEGIVVDPNANFKHLKGYLKEFFAKMGFPDIRIRPGSFPYTSPSAEVDVWHPQKNRWMELGGSGIFRPEVVKPFLGFECSVLAWGLGLERTIMEYYNITDLRDIYSNDIKKLREIKIWLK